MKKKLIALTVFTLAAALGIFALAGCAGGGAASSAAASADSSAAASADASAAPAAAEFDGKFVVGFDQEYPPYGFVGKDGEFTGFDLELAEELCKRNGWEYSCVPINWDTKLEELNAGAFVCIWNGFTMEGREADYAFSKPYMDNGQVIMVKVDSDVKALADLAGKTVGTQVDSAAHEVLEGDQAKLAGTFAALETRPDYNIAATELEAGALDALACDLSIAAYQMSQNPGKFKVLDEQLSAEHYAVGFKLGNEALADQVTATLQEMAADGTVEALCEKYAEYGISFDNWVLK